MFESRLLHGIKNVLFDWKDSFDSVVLHPNTKNDLNAFPGPKPKFVHRLKPEIDNFLSLGFEQYKDLVGEFDLAVVILPRQKELARHLIFCANKLAPKGCIMIDGANNSGIGGILRELSEITHTKGLLSKAHGKLIWLDSCDNLDCWDRSSFLKVKGGFSTKVGVFSADGADPASVRLGDILAQNLKGNIADLGAGWGYLTKRALENPLVRSVDSVEYDSVALECAKKNCDDHRVSFHWQDAINWCPKKKFDAIIMNPPFHSGNSINFDLRRAFVVAAARLLKKNGSLWVVSSRHSSFEKLLSSIFRETIEIVKEKPYSVFKANYPIK